MLVKDDQVPIIPNERLNIVEEESKIKWDYGKFLKFQLDCYEILVEQTIENIEVLFHK